MVISTTGGPSARWEEIIKMYPVSKWLAAGQGFKFTKWPAVSYFSQILRNWKDPFNPNYHMWINNPQVIQKSCIDHRSSAWLTLGSLCTSLAMSEAIAGHWFLTKDDILPVCKISDTVRDEEMVDIHHVDKYFEKDTWLSVLKSRKEKTHVDFVCSVCAKMINDESEYSIACDRCLPWTHLTCTSLKS